jgi:hypothetical protein
MYRYEEGKYAVQYEHFSSGNEGSLLSLHFSDSIYV